MLRKSLFLAVLLAVTTVRAQQPAKAPLTNGDIVAMVNGGLQESLILGAIDANDVNFDVSAGALLTLKKDGVGDKIVQAMLAAESKKRNPAPATPAPASPPASPAPQTMAMNPAMNAMAGQAMAAQMMAAAGMSPAMMAQFSAAGRGGMPNMAAMMRGGMGQAPTGDLSSDQLPKVTLLLSDMRVPMHPSVTQIAKSEIKGGGSSGMGAASGLGAMSSLAGMGMRSGMGGMGGLSSLSMLGGMSGNLLSFAPLAAGPGMVFAGPAMSIATGLLSGSLSHHSSTPTATYVWALPGAHSAFVASGTRPKFEIEFGDLVGLNPDDYEPALVKLTQTKDNFRLVGATKEKFDSRGNDKRSAITEDRTGITTTILGRGHALIEAAAPLAPGEYGVVLHPIKAKATSSSSGSGLSIEQTIFYSVWDFSITEAEASHEAAKTSKP